MRGRGRLFCAVVSGVPQGWVLGFLLFLVFNDDLETVCKGKSTLQIFANDAMLYSCVDLNFQLNSPQLSFDRLFG